MSNYNHFAYIYDKFNTKANYKKLHKYIHSQFKKAKIKNGIIADLGCGTGDLTIMLAKDGYEMVAIDYSADMLSVLNEKKYEYELPNILLLNQDLTNLDLYGTINGAVSTFDTFNHITSIELLSNVIERVALFTEKDGIFIFDMNTLYKHLYILADNVFNFEDSYAKCVWKNTLDTENSRIKIELEITYKETNEIYREDFFEYIYDIDTVKKICEDSGFEILDILDGETFKPLTEKSQRAIFTGKKITECQN